MLLPDGGHGSVRLAELVASLSLATDLGRGQPMEHCIRKTAIGLRLADLLGLSDDDRVATYVGRSVELVRELTPGLVRATRGE